MLPMIQQEVLNHHWLMEEEIIDFIAISESTPGPFAVNMSTFVGMQTGGILGAFCATLGVVLPSFVIILIVAKIFDRFQKSKTVKGAMLGLKGAVVGLIGAAILTTGISVFGNVINATAAEEISANYSNRNGISNINWKEIAASLILLAGIGLGMKKKVNPILLIIASAGIGIIVKGFIL